MNQYTRKSDANEGVIIEHLKTLGVVPHPIQAAGVGDLIVHFYADLSEGKHRRGTKGAANRVWHQGLLEVKNPDGRNRISPAQKLFGESMERGGGFYAVVCTEADVDAALADWRKRITKWATNYQRKAKR